MMRRLIRMSLRTMRTSKSKMMMMRKTARMIAMIPSESIPSQKGE